MAKKVTKAASQAATAKPAPKRPAKPATRKAASKPAPKPAPKTMAPRRADLGANADSYFAALPAQFIPTKPVSEFGTDMRKLKDDVDEALAKQVDRDPPSTP